MDGCWHHEEKSGKGENARQLTSVLTPRSHLPWCIEARFSRLKSSTLLCLSSSIYYLACDVGVGEQSVIAYFFRNYFHQRVILDMHMHKSQEDTFCE